MGLLSAFIGGAAGQGLIDYSKGERDRQQRNAELAQRADEREQDRRARADLVREQIASREQIAGDRLGAGSSASGKRIAGSELNIADIEAKADMVMRRDFGSTDSETAALRGAYKGGPNPFRKPGDGQGDTAFGKFDLREPDEARLRAMLKRLGGAEFEAAHAGSNAADDTARAAATYRQIRLSDDVMDDERGPKTGLASAVGTGQAAAAGKDLFAVQGNTKLQQFTGASTTTEVGRAEIGKDGAIAADHVASAGKKGIEAIALTENGGMTAAERVAAQRDARAAANTAAAGVRALERDLSAAEAGLSKAIGRTGKATAQAVVDRVTTALEEAKIAAKSAETEATNMRAKPGSLNSAGGANRKIAPDVITSERARAQAAIASGKSRSAVAEAFNKATGESL